MLERDLTVEARSTSDAAAAARRTLGNVLARATSPGTSGSSGGWTI
jgi:hypothetical protein